jgi:hypothetical protein
VICRLPDRLLRTKVKRGESPCTQFRGERPEHLSGKACSFGEVFLYSLVQTLYRKKLHEGLHPVSHKPLIRQHL